MALTPGVGWERRKIGLSLMVMRMKAFLRFWVLLGAKRKSQSLAWLSINGSLFVWVHGQLLATFSWLFCVCSSFSSSSLSMDSLERPLECKNATFFSLLPFLTSSVARNRRAWSTRSGSAKGVLMVASSCLSAGVVSGSGIDWPILPVIKQFQCLLGRSATWNSLK